MAKAEIVEYTTDFVDDESTSIERVWYNANTHRMTVKFKAGGTYSYDDVATQLFDEFMDAESLGQFFREVFRRPGNPWPGAKHDDRTTVFREVPIEPVVRAEPDLDAMKVVRLTTSKGPKFDVEFEYTAPGRMEVRAADAQAAIKLAKEYLRDKGFQAKVTRVTQDIS